MAIATLYNYDPLSPAQVTNELYEAVGADFFQLGTVKRAFQGGVNFEIWDDTDSNAVQLTEDVDYELGEIDTKYSDDAGYTVYTGVKILNVAYQAVDLYITYKVLGSYTDKTTLDQIAVNTAATPPGVLYLYAGDSVPSGFLECDGDSLLRSSYANLFAAIGTNYGAADGTHFNLPDLRGKFARGWDHGEGNDPDAGDRTAQDTGGNTGDNVGSVQADEFKAHTHGIDMNGSSDTTAQADGAGANANYQQTGSTGGNETRPINVNVMYIIKT